MKDTSNHIKFLNQTKRRAQESEEKILVQNIVNSISTRRHKDLFDILINIERNSCWSAAIEYLIKANGKAYSYNMGSGGPKVRLEPLKFREVIFKLFRCEGLEPITINTITLLKELRTETSMIDATRKFTQRVEELTWNQINKNDLLFFNSIYDNMFISNNLRCHILDLQRKQINDLALWKKEDRINIEPLWHSELGRKALASIGSKGLSITSDELAKLLTLIQISPKLQPQILNFDEWEKKQYEIMNPSNQDYKLLLNSIIEKKVNKLRQLGSKHSILTLKNLLFDALKHYEINPSSSNYQNVLNMIFNHVMIRELDSIPILQQLSELEDKRIATIAIISLGNFFHESAALALINLICNKRDNDVVDNALIALENLCMNSLEAVMTIDKALKTNCTHDDKLRKLHRKIQKQSYYK